MQVHEAAPNGIVQIVVPIVIFLAIFAFRARRLMRERPLQVERLWIFPAIYLAICLVMFAEYPLPSLTAWASCGVALIVGAALGWQRGKTMTITVDPVTHRLNQKASIMGIAFLFVIVALRAVARGEGSALHVNVLLVTGILLSLALGLFTTQRIEMYLRAKRLLQAARAG